MTDTQKEETTPDELMEDFRGRGLGSIIVFTVVVHAVLLFGTSVPFLMRSVMGANTSEMSEDERIESAVREATASLREIAEEHGLNPDDISSQFAGGKARPRVPKAPDAGAPKAAGSGGVTPADAGDPKPAIEEELDVKATGPALPEIKEEDEEEDLFK